MGAVCCMSEGAKVGKVMDAFEGVPASRAEDNKVEKVIGYPISREQDILVHPTQGIPVVWYHIRIFETRHYREKVQMADGDRWQARSSTNTIYERKQGCEFKLVDGQIYILVDVKNGDQAKIQTSRRQRGRDMPNGNVSKEIRKFLDGYQHKDRGVGQVVTLIKNAENHHQDRWEYSWDCTWVPVREKLCVIGAVARGGPENRLCIMAAFPDSLDEEFFKEHRWSSQQKSAWKSETKKGGAIFISNSDTSLSIHVEPSAYAQPEPRPPTPKDTQTSDNNKKKFAMPSGTTMALAGGAVVAAGAAAAVVAENPNILKDVENGVKAIF